MGCSLLVSACGGAPPAEQTSASRAMLSLGGTYTLGARAGAGSCMDAGGAGTADGTQIQEWGCNGTGAQTYDVVDAGGGAVNLINTSSGKCVDVNGAGTADGTKVQLWDCNGTGAQTFELQDAGGGLVTFVNANSGKCLDVAGDAPDDGTVVQLYDCNGTTAQQWLTSPVPPASGGGSPAPGSAGRPRGQVSVGGIDGFDSFIDSNSSTLLRAGGASLYIHQVGWGSLDSDQDRRQVAANWSGTGGAVVEMAEATDLTASLFNLGISSILEINVNAPSCDNGNLDDDSISVWQGWVDSYKAAGVVRAQYNDTPNCQTTGFDWSSSYWDDSRTRAQIGGGVVMDAPPYFYYNIETDGYRQFVKDEIAWANAAGLHSTWILSPFNGGNFLADTQQLIAELNALPPAAQPQEYAVENYGQGELVGSDTDADSVASVALWVLQNAQTYQP